MSWLTRTALMGALLLAAMLTGCEDEGDPVGPGDDAEERSVSFLADVQPIFSNNCVGCHGEDGNGGLDLRAGLSRDNLVGIQSPNYMAPRVVAGNPAASVLFDKVSGGGIYGAQMPLGGSLPLAQVEIIRRWIADGAADD